MTSVSKRKLELLKDLMRRFIDEVERGVHPLRAGWMKAEGPELNKLAQAGLVDKGERGIRIRFGMDLRIGFDDTLDEDAEELIRICADLTKAVEVEKLITRLANELQNSSRLQAGMVTLGWWRMLQTSEFSVAVDEVLREGFSPDRWYIEAPKGSLELALTLARKWWKVDKEKVFEPLRGFSFSIPEPPQTDSSERVKRVLRWEKIVERLHKEEAMAIAFLWCADYLSESNRLCYPQSLNFIQASTWRRVSNTMRKGISEIIEQIGTMVDQLPLQSSISWVEIIRFPW